MDTNAKIKERIDTMLPYLIKRQINVYNFINKTNGKACPYRVIDMSFGGFDVHDHSPTINIRNF